jgi:hypothetical protein
LILWSDWARRPEELAMVSQAEKEGQAVKYYLFYPVDAFSKENRDLDKVIRDHCY